MLWELDFIENPSTNVDEVYEDEAWKEDLEKSLFENYGEIWKQAIIKRFGSQTVGMRMYMKTGQFDWISIYKTGQNTI